MPSTILVEHNFETAHRLPQLAGKCQSLHGHSWWCAVEVEGPRSDDGTVVEFGPLKAKLRAWVDQRLDHGTMLGIADPLAQELPRHGCKVYVFGDPHGEVPDLAWPTVENVAELIGRVAQAFVDDLHPGGLHRVNLATIRETHVNQASWGPA